MLPGRTWVKRSGDPAMKTFAKTALFRSLPLRTQARLARAVLSGVAASASKQDLDLLEGLFAAVDVQQVTLEDRIRHLGLSGRVIADGIASGGRLPLRTCLMEDHSPWTDQARSFDPIAMPGMISEEEARYYEYLGELYLGKGEAIELGPWLGKSTRHIIRGLDRNPKFVPRRLHVFDDFVWRASWMDPYVGSSERLPNHADFRHLFETYVAPVRERLNVTQGKIVDYDGNAARSQIGWSGASIEIMYVDCGLTRLVNEAWYRILSPCLIPNVSLLVMQDWRTHRERPRLSYNETYWFTGAHPELEIIHEVKDGGIATFLYRGKR